MVDRADHEPPHASRDKRLLAISGLLGIAIFAVPIGFLMAWRGLAFLSPLGAIAFGVALALVVGLAFSADKGGWH